MVDLDAVRARYSRALDAKPSKGDYTPAGIASITDSVADIPDLLRLIDELGGEDNAALRADRDHWQQRFEDMRAEAHQLRKAIDRRNEQVLRVREVIGPWSHRARRRILDALDGGDPRG